MKYYYYYDMDGREIFPECPTFIVADDSEGENGTAKNYGALFLISMVALVLTFI